MGGHAAPVAVGQQRQSGSPTLEAGSQAGPPPARSEPSRRPPAPITVPSRWVPARLGTEGCGAGRGGWAAWGRGEPSPSPRCMRGSGPALCLRRRGAGGGRAKSEHSQARMFWQPFLAAWAKLFITLCIFLLICVQPAPMAQLAFCLPEPSQSLGCALSWLSIHAFCLLQLCLEQSRIPN